ncbi:MAG: hypothetical protein WCG23_00395 [bacterium]
MKIQQSNIAFGTKLKINIQKENKLFEKFIAGANAAKTELANNGIKDSLNLNFVPANSDVFYRSGVDRPKETPASYFSLSLGGIQQLFDSTSIGEKVTNPIFKSADATKKWILETYTKLTTKVNS